ncbi:GNAT family N-acetyltransferase [Roseivirga sp.]|uniref:GNAT family N-acetyltransferase n=1 Tax=Roseivirga sp. TaxID=1964215 RepID=UPI003B52D5A5
MLTILIRKGSLNDLNTLQSLFTATIQTVCRADYNEEQIRVWSSGAKNQERWYDILTKQEVFVAEINNQVVGFTTLYQGSYIDMFYVHKDFQGMGIARKLYTQTEQLAKTIGSVKLSAHVSITARPFFERSGFRVVKQQTVMREEVTLINYHMEKILANNPVS